MNRKAIFTRARKWAERPQQKKLRLDLAMRSAASTIEKAEKYIVISDRAAYIAGYEAALRDTRKPW